MDSGFCSLKVSIGLLTAEISAEENRRVYLCFKYQEKKIGFSVTQNNSLWGVSES